MTSEQSIARFVTHLTVEKGLSPATISAYRADLAQLSQFLGARQLADARRRDIGEFIEKRLAEREPRSVRRMASTFRNFFSFLLSEGIIREDPTSRFGPIKVERVLPQSPYGYRDGQPARHGTEHGPQPGGRVSPIPRSRHPRTGLRFRPARVRDN
jgi:site-specific recombinase XerD